ncbi:MAG: hypothetical protein KAJ19_14850 [Gammaproteobacteria bacterium]|nr:hypothetical protein [Gammaproteobacteria bacterium]
MNKMVNGKVVKMSSIEESVYIEQSGLRATEQAKTQYKIDRLSEYPPTGDQLDMMYWDKVNGTNEWQNLIQSIKAKYPK